MHYGITYNVFDYAFDKHWYMATDMTSCPSKLFQKPPTMDELPVEPGSQEHRRLSVALSVAQGLYDATRDHAVRVCGIESPVDPERIRYRCKPNEANIVICTQKGPNEIDPPPPPRGAGVALRGGAGGAGGAGGEGACADKEEACCDWAGKGECDKNADFMLLSCAKACGRCAKAAGSCLKKDKEKAAAAGTERPPAPVVISDALPTVRVPRKGAKGSKGGKGGAKEQEHEHVDPALAHQVPERKLKPHVAGATHAAGGGHKKATPGKLRVRPGGKLPDGESAPEADTQPQEEAEAEEEEEEEEEAEEEEEEAEAEEKPAAEEEEEEAEAEEEEAAEEEEDASDASRDDVAALLNDSDADGATAARYTRARIMAERSSTDDGEDEDSESGRGAAARRAGRVRAAAWWAIALACGGACILRRRRSASTRAGLSSGAKARLAVAAAPGGAGSGRGSSGGSDFGADRKGV
jgi:hypothetical protein